MGVFHQFAVAVGGLVVFSSSAIAQQALPTIDVGASNRRPAANHQSSGDGGAPARAAATTQAEVPEKEKPFAKAIPDNIPAVVETVTQKDIREKINAVTAVETVRYAPSIDIRERFVGDRNPMIGWRTVTQDTPAQSMVYMDGILLSNYLGNYYNFPPVFQMVSPDEISRVDLMYGPFSSLYAGNSYGGVLTFTTRMPEKFELHAKLGGMNQRFDLYNTHSWYPGYDAYFSVGHRLNDLSVLFTYNHLLNNSQPMQYSNPTVSGFGGSGYPVYGGIFQLNNVGRIAAIAGSFNQYTIAQDTYKLKLAYDLAPAVRLSYTGALWDMSQDSLPETYLRSSINGLPVFNAPRNPFPNFWFGQVSQAGLNYFPFGLNPNYQSALRLSQGLELRSQTGGVFDVDAVVSANNFLYDQSKSMFAYGATQPGRFLFNTSGQNINMAGTNWIVGELRGIYRPQQDLLGRHEVTLGGHFDQYVLNQNVTSLPYYPSNIFAGGWPNWTTHVNPNQSSYGKTQAKALYVQDVWSFLPDWKLTYGLRQEFWEAFDGSFGNFKGRQDFAAKDYQHLSPKAALSWQATPELLLRASYGNAMRFPTVTELYQNYSSSSGVNIPNPNLVPEQVDSYDLTAEYRFGKHSARVTYFHEDRWNEIISQINPIITPPVNTLENVGKSQFNGFEAAASVKDFVFDRLDVDASLTLAGSQILSNYMQPLSIGKWHPGIASFRAKVVGTYHPTEELSITGAMRYSSNPFSLLDNSDWNHFVFGARSGYLLFDSKINYKLDRNWTASIGCDNIGSFQYYDYHPFTQRTFFASLRYDY